MSETPLERRQRIFSEAGLPHRPHNTYRSRESGAQERLRQYVCETFVVRPPHLGSIETHPDYE
jgi:hypothetical protein